MPWRQLIDPLAPLFRAAACALGLAAGYLTLRASGLMALGDHILMRGEVNNYSGIFFSLLASIIVVYFFLSPKPRRLTLNLTLGLLAGAACSFIALVASAYIEFGIAGFILGIETAGWAYLALLAGVSIFPLAGWLAGAVSFVAVGKLAALLEPNVD